MTPSIGPGWAIGGPYMAIPLDHRQAGPAICGGLQAAHPTQRSGTAHPAGVRCGGEGVWPQAGRGPRMDLDLLEDMEV